MSKIYSLGFVLSLTAGVFLGGCKKTADKSYQNISQTAEERKFFESNISDDPFVKTISAYISKENRRYHFVENLSKRLGFPRWNKTIIMNGLAVKNGLELTGDTMNVTIIPFVRESENFVNATLMIKATSTDTTAQFMQDWQYAQLQNSISSAKDSAEAFAGFFMEMDKRVFGHTKFLIRDSALFRDGSHKALYITLNSQGTKEGKSNVLMPMQQCQDFLVSFVDCQYRGQPVCTPVCDHCPLCMSEMVYTYCWYEMVDIGGGGGNTGGSGEPGGSGSGGGNGGGWVPPICTGIALKTSRTDCGPGWVPIEDGHGQLAQQLNAILQPGDSYTFSNNIPAGDALYFSSVTAFQTYYNTNFTNESFSLNFQPIILNQNEKIERARFMYGTGGGVDVFVKLSKNANNTWDATDVSSSEYGVSIGWAWEQSAYSRNTSATEIVIDVHGYIKYNIIFDGLGTLFKKERHYRIKINRTTGTITSIEKIS
jgi:hypothetical protein